jgi:hypothetical protein
LTPVKQRVGYCGIGDVFEQEVTPTGREQAEEREVGSELRVLCLLLLNNVVGIPDLAGVLEQEATPTGREQAEIAEMDCRPLFPLFAPVG